MPIPQLLMCTSVITNYYNYHYNYYYISQVYRAGIGREVKRLWQM